MTRLILSHHSPAEWAAAIRARLLWLGCSALYADEAAAAILRRAAR